MASSPHLASSPLLCLLAAACLGIVVATTSGCDSGGSTEPPNPPTSLTLSQIDNGTVRVSWTAGSTPGVGYNVYRSPESFSDVSSLSPVNGSPVSDTSFDDGGISNATTYFYRVTAVGEGGDESVPSAEQQITVSYPTPPDRPS
jgi:fibronectin type 3 domain-containing protein